MRYIILFLLSFSISTSGQTINQIDSLTVKMCSDLAELDDLKDDVKINIVFEKHLSKFYENLQVQSQQKADSINDKIFFRLQLNCELFRDILDRNANIESDWKKLAEKPTAQIKKNNSIQFFSGGVYEYKEHQGDVVVVEIKDGYWKESFSDGTYSKLSFHKTSENEFYLKFEESNNRIRSNLSVPGDWYYYGLYGYANNAYDVWVRAEKDSVFYGFKIYAR